MCNVREEENMMPMVQYLTLDRLSNTQLILMFISKSHGTVKAVFDTDCVCVCVDSLFCKIPMSLRVILQVTSTYNFSLFNFCTFQKIFLWKHNRVCSYTMMEHLLVTLKLYPGGYFPGLWVSCGGPHLGYPYLWKTGSVLALARSDVPLESRNLSRVAI